MGRVEADVDAVNEFCCYLDCIKYLLHESCIMNSIEN